MTNTTDNKKNEIKDKSKNQIVTKKVRAKQSQLFFVMFYLSYQFLYP